MEIDAECIERVVDKAVRRGGEDAWPAFYAVTGSHIYGFPSEEGDVDVGGSTSRTASDTRCSTNPTSKSSSTRTVSRRGSRTTPRSTW
jgi:hypothetical protein